MIAKKLKQNKRTLILFTLLLLTMAIALTACSSSADSIAGTWVDVEDSDEMSLYEDGTCLNTPIRNVSEDAISYKLQEDGKLIFELEWGSTRVIDPAESQDEAVEDNDLYYLNGDTLVLESHVYERQ